MKFESGVVVKKLLLISSCLFLAACLVAGIVLSQRNEQAKAEELERINQQLAPLYTRKLELEAELKQLEDTTAAQLSGMGTLSLVLTDVNSAFLEQAAPALEQAEIPAVLALSPERLPDGEGCITLSDFNRYMDEDGWDYCLVWDGTEEFGSWYDTMAQRLEALELDMPKAVYCAGGSYTAAMEAAAKEKGIDTIVHSGEENFSLVETQVGEIWRPGALGWLTQATRNRLDQAVVSYGSIVFAVDPGEENDFQTSQFVAMLETLNAYKDEKKLKVDTLVESWAYREEVERLKAGFQDEVYAAKVQELQTEVETLKEQIRAIQNGG